MFEDLPWLKKGFLTLHPLRSLAFILFYLFSHFSADSKWFYIMFSNYSGIILNYHFHKNLLLETRHHKWCIFFSVQKPNGITLTNLYQSFKSLIFLLSARCQDNIDMQVDAYAHSINLLKTCMYNEVDVRYYIYKI